MRNNRVILSFALLSIFLVACSPISKSNNLFANNPSLENSNTPSSALGNPAFWQNSPENIWAQLQQIPLQKLIQNQNNPNPLETGWVKLAIISKRYSVNTQKLTQELIAWRTQYGNHPGNQLFPDNNTLNSLANSSTPHHFALLLPLSGQYAQLGNATREGFLQSFNQAQTNGNHQQINFYDTNSNPNIAALYQEAINKGADVVIGPLTKDEVKQLSNSGSFSIPTLALNYTDLWFGSLPANLYEFGLSPHDEAKQVANKALEAGRNRAIMIAPQTEWGQTVSKTLTTQWQSKGGKITDTYYFSPKSNLSADIPRLLHIDTKYDREQTRNKLSKTALALQRRQDFDVVFLLAPPQSARQIVPLLRYYYVDKTSIYATSIVYNGTPNPQYDIDLNGVNFPEIPWTLSHMGSNRLVAVGQDAYSISNNLNRFTVLTNFPLYGATGAISLTPQKQFYRRLAWAQFHDGQT